MVDASYVISMATPVGQERLRLVNAQFDAAGLPRPTVFHGINGKALSAAQLQESTTLYCQVTCTPAMVGCGLSHLAICQRMLRDGARTVLIMEDDVVITNGFAEKMQRALAEVPDDFDILLLGCSVTCNAAQKNGPPGPGVRPVSTFAGLHCYVVSRRGAQKILGAISRLDKHIDVQLQEVPGLRAFVVHEDLAHQDEKQFTNSQNASVSSFPIIANSSLGNVYDSKRVPLSYYVTQSALRLGPYHGPHIRVTKWHYIFLVLGLLKVPWSLVLAFVAVDAGVGTSPATPASYVADAGLAVAMFAVGRGTHEFFFKP